MTEWRRGEYVITTDPARVDLAVVHGYLSASYWAKDIPVEVVRRSIEHSLNFSIYHGEHQVGFARVITDYAVFAYVADVFVVASHRGKGVGRELMAAIVAHPALQRLRRWHLVTRDAHRLYEQFGFQPLRTPERHMEIVVSDPYKLSS